MKNDSNLNCKILETKIPLEESQVNREYRSEEVRESDISPEIITPKATLPVKHAADCGKNIVIKKSCLSGKNLLAFWTYKDQIIENIKPENIQEEIKEDRISEIIKKPKDSPATCINFLYKYIGKHRRDGIIDLQNSIIASKSLWPNDIKIQHPHETLPQKLPTTELDTDSITPRDSEFIHPASSTISKPMPPKKSEEFGKLFEEFFIIGIDPKSLEGHPIKGNKLLRPENLAMYPNLPQNSNWYFTYEIKLNSERRKAVKDFCFPEGVKVTELKQTDSMSEALRYYAIF